MKLLGWMHRKFRQESNNNIFGDSIHGCQPSEKCHLAPATSFEDEFMLDGLLTIGTLGLASDPIIEEEEPSSLANVEAIAEKEEEEATTETDLIIINTELEKVLLAESDHDTSARPSHVTKASTECPLQDYLFGAKVETTTERKEKRPSLGELFMIDEGKKDEETQGSGGNSMKRTLTWHKSSKSAARARSKDKLQKVLQIFHRKIHPENDNTAKPMSKHCKKSRSMRYIGHCFNGGAKNYPDTPNSECTSRMELIDDTSIKTFQDPDPPSFPLSKSDSMGSREYWIKTDVDYLVLEL